MEGGRRVAETEGHYAELVMALVCAKRGLRDIGRCHANLMEALPEVELHKLGSFAKIVMEFIHRRHRKFIFDGNGIKCPVINTTAP